MQADGTALALFADPPVPPMQADATALALFAPVPVLPCGQMALPPHSLHTLSRLPWMQMAPPLHSLHVSFNLLCEQMRLPAHSLQERLCLACSQMRPPLHSLQLYLILPCEQMALPPQSLHSGFRLPCSHFAAGFRPLPTFVALSAVAVGAVVGIGSSPWVLLQPKTFNVAASFGMSRPDERGRLVCSAARTWCLSLPASLASAPCRRTRARASASATGRHVRRSVGCHDSAPPASQCCVFRRIRGRDPGGSPNNGASQV